jgi:hypothetical protein
MVQKNPREPRRRLLLGGSQYINGIGVFLFAPVVFQTQAGLESFEGQQPDAHFLNRTAGEPAVFPTQ